MSKRYRKFLLATIIAGLAAAQGIEAATTLPLQLPFTYSFKVNGTLEDSRSIGESTSPYWWLKSGGELQLENGLGKTIQGAVNDSDLKATYAQKYPVASDNGLHPQNLFRMFTRTSWKNVSASIQARITRDNLSDMRNRAPYNGISLVSRYKDADNFYYAGVRMDGGIVIKKKINGTYYTLGYKKHFPGVYDLNANPNLLPKNKWFDLRMDTVSNSNDTVSIFFYINEGNGWKLLLGANDDGKSYGGGVLATEGPVGIYSDYMDIEFDNFKLGEVGVNTSVPLPSPIPLPTPNPTPTPSPVPTPTPSPTLPLTPGVLFNDSFSQYPDGLITNEYAYWSPGGSGAKVSSVWEMTSGSLFAQGGAGWTGVPNAGTPNALSTSANNSSIFRLTTKRSDFGNVAVSFDLLNQGLSSNSVTPAVDWDGAHIFLRYQSEESLYYASINRRDNAVVIKKKVPGGPSNGGTYYNIGSTKPYTVPYNTWQKIKATIKNNADGSVTIELFANGDLILSTTDKGTGGAPIRGAGKVGIRGDNANLKFKNFTVTNL